MYNQLIVLQANGSVVVGNYSRISGPLVFLCGNAVRLGPGTSLVANSSGCIANQGIGAGAAISSSLGGCGGGGYGGTGGFGTDFLNSGGVKYVSSVNGNSSLLSSGSGGGCVPAIPYSCNTTSRGGGIISIRALSSTIIHGNISANGGNGMGTAGGGSGGSISIITGKLTGRGYLTANGGMGGYTSSFQGGGGGGGLVQISSLVGDYAGFDFSGVLSAAGGLPGSSLQSYLRDVSSASTLRQELEGMVLAGSSATGGSTGDISLPKCEAGFGSNPSVGSICQPCQIGYYSTGNGEVNSAGDSCLACTNAPTHSYYTDVQCPTSACPYQCKQGFSTDKCYNPFQKFLFDTLGWGGIAGVMIGVFAIILVPLFAYRLKKKLDVDKEMRMLRDRSDFLKSSAITDVRFDFHDEKATNKHADLHGEITENPIFAHQKHGIGFDDSRTIRVLHAKHGQDQLREHRMADQDMPFHAARINFLGCNHPFSFEGGPWILPTKRPACVRPMLLREEYRAFAQKINKMMSWDFNSKEMYLLYLAALFAPPLVAIILRIYRKRRADMLLDFIATYDYACFRSPEQRKTRNSLRISIAPDATLAYLDFLFDEDHHNPRCKPLCPIGQAKLPAAFRFAGLGSYSTPYYIDTNDLILQAVPQTDVASAFIDSAWVNFVFQLNLELRTVQSDAIYQDILRLMKFLADEKNTANLGGLVVEFCTFSNVPPPDEAPSSVSERSVSADREEPTPAELLAAAKNANTVSLRDADSFIAATTTNNTGRLSLDNDPNWLEKIGGVLANQLAKRTNALGQHQSSDGVELSDKSGSLALPSFAIGTQSEAVPRSTEGDSRSGALSWFGRMLSRIRDYWALTFSDCFTVQTTCAAASPDGGYVQPRSFAEMCEAIKQGKLVMGIVVSHPKVLEDISRPFETGVGSSAFASNDDLQSLAAGQDSGSSDESGSDSGDETASITSRTARSVAGSESRDRVDSLHTIAEGRESIESSGSWTSDRGISAEAIQRAYKHKADEIARFYRIMNDAENVPAAPALSSSLPPSRTMSFDSQPASVPSEAGLSSPGSRAGESPLARLERTRPSRAQSNTSVAPSVRESAPSTLTEFRELTLTSYTRPSAGLHTAATASSGQDAYTELSRGMGGNRDSLFSGQSPADLLDAKDDDFARRSVVVSGEHDDADDHVETRRGGEESYTHAMRSGRAESKGDVEGSDSRKLSPSRSSRWVEDRPEVKLGPVEISSVAVRTRRQARRKRPRKKSNDATRLFPSAQGLSNLAPSCFQENTRAWHYREGDGLPTNDGRLGHSSLWIAKQMASVDLEQGDLPRFSSASLSALSIDSSQVRRKLSSQSLPGFRTEANSRESLSENPRPSRDFSLMNTLMRMSLYYPGVGPLAHEGQSAPVNQGPAGALPPPSSSSLAMDTAADAPTSTARMSTEVAIERERQISRPDSLRPATMCSLNDNAKSHWLVSWWQYAKVNNFFVHYLTRFMLGFNVHPYGPRQLRKILEMVLFVLCLSDLCLWGITLFDSICASENYTECTNHTALYLIISVWPAAFLIAPISGMATVVLGPSSSMARTYAWWSRLAALNNLMLILMTIRYSDFYQSTTGSFYPVICISISRVLQCVLVDLYVAHIERMRYTRGWDGLHTSLFKTMDNKQEVNL